MTEPHLQISWSALRAHSSCKMASHLGRTGAKSSVLDHRVFFRGTVVDRVMRWRLESPDATAGSMPDMVEEIMATELQKLKDDEEGIVKWKSATDRRESIDWCKELVTRLEPLLQQHVLPYEYETAKRFKVPVQIPYLDGRPTWIYLTGELDLLIRDDQGNWRVWDLKGTADNSYWRKTLGQLIFYAVYVELGFGDYPVSTGFLQPMCDHQDPQFEFGPDDYAEMWVQITRMASDVWQKDHEMKKTSAGCSRCFVRQACERFKPVRHGGAGLSSGLSLLDLA